MSKSVAVIGQGFVGGSLTTVLAEKGLKVFTCDKMGKSAPGSIDVSKILFEHGKMLRALGNYDADIAYVRKQFFRALNIPKDMYDSIEYVNFMLEAASEVELRSVEYLVGFCESKKDEYPYFLYDQTREKSNFTNIYFVCVPTPMRADGSADLTIVESVLDTLSSIPGERIAVIKSTVPPGSTMRWNEKYEKTGLKVVFNPEFLREATALEDMRNQDRIILGGPRPWINKVKSLYESVFQNVKIIKTSSTTAEMVKYVTNIHLAVKVSLANEFYQICGALDKSGLDIDYDKVVEYATYDERLGRSHWKVPGPMPSDDTGEPAFGFGGSCFIKDLNALVFLAKELGIKSSVMEGAWEKNLEVRPQKDWEKLIGRSVSEEKK